jgi:hypothetical protein
MGDINPQIDLVYVCFLQGRVYNLLKNRKFHEVSSGIPCVAWEKSRYGKASRLRFQIEFNFRDAKQHWGLEDFMVVNKTPVYNSANLAMFMVNVSQALIRPMRLQGPELSMNDLKTWFRSRKYVVETLKLLPEMPETIFMDQAIAQVAQLGRINHVVNPA